MKIWLKFAIGIAIFAILLNFVDWHVTDKYIFNQIMTAIEK